MRLTKKLEQWQQAGFIDAMTADNISEYEKQSAKPIALWAFGGLGAFAIILGLVSIVASNWMAVSDEMKLAADLVLCLGIAFALYRAVSHDNASARSQWLREILVIVYYGFTLASMALIGQTYQLGGSIAKLLLVWTIVTIPIVLLGRGKFLAVLWIVGTAVTYAMNVEALSDLVFAAWGEHHYLAEALLVATYALSPFFFILISRISWLVKNRLVMADTLSLYSWLALIIGGWFLQFLWYENMVSMDTEDMKSLQIFLGICFVATVAMVVSIPTLYATRSRDTHTAMRVIFITIFILGASAFWHERPIDLMGALSNLVYLLVLAWAALKVQSIRMFNFVTALICIRLLFVYFEVFGSMFETGLGLVIGGFITLFIVWLWFKKSDTVAGYFGLSKADKLGSKKATGSV